MRLINCRYMKSWWTVVLTVDVEHCSLFIVSHKPVLVWVLGHSEQTCGCAFVQKSMACYCPCLLGSFSAIPVLTGAWRGRHCGPVKEPAAIRCKVSDSAPTWSNFGKRRLAAAERSARRSACRPSRGTQSGTLSVINRRRLSVDPLRRAMTKFFSAWGHLFSVSIIWLLLYTEDCGDQLTFHSMQNLFRRSDVVFLFLGIWISWSWKQVLPVSGYDVRHVCCCVCVIYRVRW